MHLAATDAADQGFSLKAKSHQAFGESLLLAGQVSLWQIAQVLNSNYGPMCVEFQEFLLAWNRPKLCLCEMVILEKTGSPNPGDTTVLTEQTGLSPLS